MVCRIFLTEFRAFVKNLLRIRIRSESLTDSVESESSPNLLDSAESESEAEYSVEHNYRQIASRHKKHIKCVIIERTVHRTAQIGIHTTFSV